VSHAYKQIHLPSVWSQGAQEIPQTQSIPPADGLAKETQESQTPQSSQEIGQESSKNPDGQGWLGPTNRHETRGA